MNPTQVTEHFFRQEGARLVATLTATDIYDNIGSRPLCKLMLRHGFPGAKAPGNR